MQETQTDLDLMPRPRITATVPEEVYQFLVEWADREQRPLANLVSYVLTNAVKEIQEKQQKNGSLQGKD